MSEKTSLNLSNLMKGNERSKHSKSGKKNFRKYDTQRSEFKNSSQAVDKLLTAESQSEYDESQDEFKDSGSSTEIDVLSEHDGNEKREVNLLYLQNLKKRIENLIPLTDEKIRRRNINRRLYPDLSSEINEWERYTSKIKEFKGDFISLHPGECLESFLVDDALEALIDQHGLRDFVCLIEINYTDRILKDEKEMCYRYLGEVH
jgi:hypothetical protein